VTLTINGETLRHQVSRKLFFGHIMPLQPGDNRLVLEATDQAGGRGHQEVVVHRQIASITPPDVPLRVMLLPLESQDVATGFAELATRHLLTALVKQGRFQVVTREWLTSLVWEQQLSQTSLIDAVTAVRMGQLAGAEGIIAGHVTMTSTSWTAAVRFIDVETSVLLAEVSVYGDEPGPAAVRTLMEGLALKLRQCFPRLQGRVLQVDRNQVVVDLGRQHLAKSMKLLIFRPREVVIHPITAQRMETPAELVGELVLETVSDRVAQGVLRSLMIPGGVKPRDYVILK
jgi:hypothetical protein